MAETVAHDKSLGCSDKNFRLKYLLQDVARRKDGVKLLHSRAGAGSGPRAASGRELPAALTANQPCWRLTNFNSVSPASPTARPSDPRETLWSPKALAIYSAVFPFKLPSTYTPTSVARFPVVCHHQSNPSLVVATQHPSALLSQEPRSSIATSDLELTTKADSLRAKYYCVPEGTFWAMAMAETTDPSDRHSRRKPFTSWMKRLTNRKHSSSHSPSKTTSGKRGNKGKRQDGLKNNPYPLSGTARRPGSSHSYNDMVSYAASSVQNGGQGSSQQSLRISVSEHNNLGHSAKSTAPTLSTNGDTTRSEAGYSKAGTLATGHGGTTGGGEGSTFSSPAPSVRSLTTTLTTVQSTAPSAQIYGAYNNQAHNGSSLPHVNSYQNNNPNQQVQFSHQFPPSPASAVPPHLAPNSHPTTYSSATANSLLTDNASILTLASSSKRRRRNSLDTNASVRALAPSSVFGGSRESLPLSVLSANVGEASNASVSNVPGVLGRQSLGGLANAERMSVYSASGTVPLIAGGDRGSLIASKQGDNGSIRSGIQGHHARNDSAAGSMTGGTPPTSVLPTSNSNSNNNTAATTTPTGSSALLGRVSRRSSTWGEISGDGEEDAASSQTEQQGTVEAGDCNKKIVDHQPADLGSSKENRSSSPEKKESNNA